MTKSSIQWTNETWNPVRGCSRVSEGCRNCYAERIAVRFSGPGQPYEGFADVPPGRRHSQTGAATCGVRGHWTGRVELIPEKLEEPLRWKRPRLVFVNSMSDLFHEALSGDAVEAVFAVMAATPRHTYQILTKRPERMRQWASARSISRPSGWSWPLPNVWLGVSVEDQATADKRVSLLLQTPAAVRFVSYEPALGPMDLSNIGGKSAVAYRMIGVEPRRLDWVIMGGESGPGARSFDLAWARSVLRQCREAGVPCFVKQLGARPFDSTIMLDRGSNSNKAVFGISDSKGGDPSEWPEDLRVREFPR